MNLPFSLTEPQALILLLTLVPVIYLGTLSVRARPRDRSRIVTSIVIRSAILIMLVLAIAGMQWISQGGPLNVVFLIDESASVTQASRDAAYTYVRDAISSMGPDDRAGVVLFGEKAIVDRAVSAGTDWQPFGNHPAGVATNIAEAIQVGSGLFPEGGSRRLVLLSDGLETVDTASDLAARAKQSGIQLSVVPLGSQSQNEVAVEQVASPASVPQGQTYDVKVLLKSTSSRTATVTLDDGTTQVGQQVLQMQPGQSTASFQVKAADVGFRSLTATVNSVDDYYSENNSASSYTVVRTPPSVLIVASASEDAAPLQAALKAGGIAVEVTDPDGMPSTIDGLSKYDVVVLANVSAAAVGDERQTLLQSFVRDLGHGLVMLGGELSYGAGGYLRSTLENVLPVTMDVRTSDQRASIAMTYVVDKSGSMGRCHCGTAQTFDPTMRTEFGPSKVEIAKDAIARSAALLNSSDQVGVVGFDDSSHVLEPLQAMRNLGATGLQQDLQPVTADGGTNIAAGLQAGIDQLKASNAGLKHLILISDGWTQQASFTDMLAQLKSDNITLTTIGAGDGPGDILKTLAQAGGGRYYTATNIYDLPDVLLKETVQLAGQYYVEKQLTPVVDSQSPILKGLPTNLPPLLGYNATTVKPEADSVLRSPDGDPILATWQYGLGRSVAWTPDMKGRWATNWVAWPQFSQFAGQIMSWVVPQNGTSGLQATYKLAPAANPSDQDVAVSIASVDDAGRNRTGLQTTVTITNTETGAKQVAVTEGAPGIYEGAATGLPQGVYEVGIEQRDPETGDLVARDTSGFTVPYPSEFNIVDNSAQVSISNLSDLAQLGGGKVLALANPGAAFTHDIQSQPLRVPLWPWLLLASIILFPLDVATRRLSINWGDLRRGWKHAVSVRDKGS